VAGAKAEMLQDVTSFFRTPELLTTAEMAEADRLAIEGGIAGSRLMERAGAAVADAAVALLGATRRSRRVAVFCGPGNNGGDGFVAARRLALQGIDVQLGLLCPRDALKGDAATAAAAWRGPVLPVAEIGLDEADLAIDALFGAGLTRDLDGVAAETVRRLNAWTRRTSRPVVAVDVPSGIDGTSGEVRGVAIEARCSVTFFRLKPGHLLLPGKTHCGVLRLADIGIPACVLARIKPFCSLNGPDLWAAAFPRLEAGGNKYGRGHAVVVSGGPVHTGAARLAARGALRAGAGLVTVATPRDALAAHAAALNAIMTRLCDGPEELSALLADQRLNALIMGPALGVGEATCRLVEAALRARSERPRAVVLDADALTSFADDLPRLVTAIQGSAAHVALTPHEGEFQRLFNAAAQDAPALAAKLNAKFNSSSKLERCRAAAALSGAVVLLKGADTVVAAPDGRATLAADLPPTLATAGSGDVLAGMIGGLAAQAMPIFEAASAAAWLHGAAARRFGPGLISEDIPEALPGVFSALLRPDGRGGYFVPLPS